MYADAHLHSIPWLQGNHDNLVTCGDEQASPSKALVAQVYQRFFSAKVRSHDCCSCPAELRAHNLHVHLNLSV